MNRITRRRVLQTGGGTAALLCLPVAKGASPVLEEAVGEASSSDREMWLRWLERVSMPVLDALEHRELHKRMPVEAVAGREEERRVGTHLEAFGRLLAGLAPWLELEDDKDTSAFERELKLRFRRAALAAVISAVDPTSADYMRFGDSGQTLVDASYLSLALLRAPRQLLEPLGATTRQQLITALHAERKVLPPFSNWLLFAAMNEAMLHRLGADWDRVRIDYALRELEAWYIGDGTYSDGIRYHNDFYNSYVMQPYLLALYAELDGEPVLRHERATIVTHAQRYAIQQERVIGPDGTYPPIGRSITYRAGAFHLLADVTLRGLLPESLSPAAVRGALGAVQHRTLDAPGTFDPAGWLRIGLAGHQPSLADIYISTGSLYMCSLAWLPLGLAPSHPFWSSPAEDWTQRKIWAGLDVHADHSVD